jgi:MFS family permease
MKKWSLSLKVFLGILAVGILYVLIATIVRLSSGQIDTGTAVTRFIVGALIGLVVAGFAAAITKLVVDFKNKKKLNIPLIVFLIGAVVAVLYVLVRTIIRVSTGEIDSDMAVVRFIIGSIMYVAGAGVLAGIAAIVIAIKKLGE